MRSSYGSSMGTVPWHQWMIIRLMGVGSTFDCRQLRPQRGLVQVPLDLCIIALFGLTAYRKNSRKPTRGLMGFEYMKGGLIEHVGIIIHVGLGGFLRYMVLICKIQKLVQEGGAFS